MKTVERIMIKVVIIQFGVLLFSQWFFHQVNAFPKLTQMAKYEGVNENTKVEILETFKRK
ncbi:YpfB family protein [Neobacillus sp. SM06]|uniref:YpfB family protein n=1 Tax=Neobacillus sp. SM06 TaxID=3422492 RepID=UPI003D28BC76